VDPAGDPPCIALVDGGMISGWRRAKPALSQLDRALAHLRAAHPDTLVAVIADPALKHSLTAADRDRLEADIAAGAVVLAPAGTIGGFSGFAAKVVERAAAGGLRPVVVTDQAVPGATLGRARLDGEQWEFDLDGNGSPAPGRTRAPGRPPPGPPPSHRALLDALATELARQDADGSAARRLPDPAAAAAEAVSALLGG